MPGCDVEFQGAAAPAVHAELRTSRPAAATEQAVAEWIAKLGGKATVREGAVREVDLSRTPVSDAQLVEHLRALRNIESLSLESTEIG